MGATANDRNTVQKHAGISKSLVVKALEVIPFGVLVCTDANGEAVNASDAAGLKIAGVSMEAVDNTVDGHRIRVEEGVFAFALEADLTALDVGRKVYVKDNQTVAQAAGTNAIVAGTLVEIDSEGAGFLKIEANAPATIVTEDVGAKQITGAKIADAAIQVLGFTGKNGAGACTCTGAAVGDKVAGVVNLTDGGTKTSSFEAAITVVNQIQQSEAADLSAKNFSVTLIKR